MSILEGRDKNQIAEEWKFKVLPTYLLGTVIWIPLQIINFKLVSPQYRVAYVASLVLLEVNVLCVIKKLSPKGLEIELQKYWGNPTNEKFDSSKAMEKVAVEQNDDKCDAAIDSHDNSLKDNSNKGEDV